MQLAENVQMTHALPAKWIAHLMMKMQAMYGAKFTQQWQGIDPGILQNEWAEQLAGFTGDELAAGLAACRERPFPPTLPEFMVLCRPPIRPEVAFHEAVHCLRQRQKGERGDWTHPAIYHAAISIGQHDIMNCSYVQLRTRWDKALSDQLAKGEWTPVPEASIALPEPRKTQMSDEEAKKAMQRLGAGGVLDKSGRDHKDWARKILDDPKGRPLAMVAMARRALEERAA